MSKSFRKQAPGADTLALNAHAARAVAVARRQKSRQDRRQVRQHLTQQAQALYASEPFAFESLDQEN